MIFITFPKVQADIRKFSYKIFIAPCQIWCAYGVQQITSGSMLHSLL